MLLNVAYYAIESYPIIPYYALQKNLMKFIIQHKIHAFKVHSSSSQYNCTTGCNAVSTVRESDSSH